jgi:hypothetical protein
MTVTPTLQWSESVPPVAVQTGTQLDYWLDQLRPESPISVVLSAHGCEAHLLLGLEESFVYLDEVSRTVTVHGIRGVFAQWWRGMIAPHRRVYHRE